MSWDINRVIIVGRLSNDVELKYTPSNMAVAKFGIAVGGKPKPDGSDSVSFFNVVVWGKSGENCSNFLSKGKQVAIDGRLEQRSWTAQDGTKRSVVEIVADRVEFLGASGGNTSPKPSKEGGKDKTPAAEQFTDSFYDNTDFNSTPVDPSFYDEGNNRGDPNF